MGQATTNKGQPRRREGREGDDPGARLLPAAAFLTDSVCTAMGLVAADGREFAGAWRYPLLQEWAESRVTGSWILLRHAQLAEGWLPSLLAEYDPPHAPALATRILIAAHS